MKVFDILQTYRLSRSESLNFMQDEMESTLDQIELYIGNLENMEKLEF